MSDSKMGPSKLALQLKQKIDIQKASPIAKLEQVRILVEGLIWNNQLGTARDTSKLDQVPLAYTVKDLLDQDKKTDEEKVKDIRILITPFIAKG